MNIIISYLDTMFSAYPQTPRLLEAKAELQGMMEDAYANLIAEGKSENEAVGQVIRDFGNLAEVAPELGITTEIGHETPAPAAAQAAPAPGLAEAAPPRPQLPPVTLDEAQGYTEAKRQIRYRVAIAIALFVLSPSTLLLLSAASSNGLIALDAGPASLIGIVALLATVALGVIVLFGTSRVLAPYERLEERRFQANPTVSQWATAFARPHDRARTLGLQIALAFWILSPLPLVAISLLGDRSPLASFWVVGGVVIMLAMVAIGLLIFLPTSWAHTAAELLTLQGTHPDPSGPDSEEHSIVGVIASFYWPIVVAIYLGWSFISNDWGSSWVIWPIGAVLFGAIAAGFGAWDSYRKSRRR